MATYIRYEIQVGKINKNGNGNMELVAMPRTRAIGETIFRKQVKKEKETINGWNLKKDEVVRVILARCKYDAETDELEHFECLMQKDLK